MTRDESIENEMKKYEIVLLLYYKDRENPIQTHFGVFDSVEDFKTEYFELIDNIRNIEKRSKGGGLISFTKYFGFFDTKDLIGVDYIADTVFIDELGKTIKEQQ